MKVNFLKSVVIENRRHSGVTLLVCLFVISVALQTGVAQVKNKRVTSIQMGQAAGGARVTIVSDSALNDYEAFRRGDRFYVKIPVTDFAASQPNLHGDGFEDVQVQKVGDSVVASFRLQPGASARVDQRSNRLDVIFSAPNKLTRSNTPNPNRATAGTETGTVPVTGNPNQPGSDAGPMPPNTPPVSRERVFSETAGDGQIAQVPGVYNNPRGALNKKGTEPPTTNATVPAAPQSDSSATDSSLGSSNYPALSTGTPFTVASQPVANSPGLAQSSNWKIRSNAVLQWVAAHRMAASLGALLVLSVVVFFGLAHYRRRNKVVKAKRATAPRVQPKYSPDVELNEKFTAGPGSSQAPALSEVVAAFESNLRTSNSTSLAAEPKVASGNGASAGQKKADQPRIMPEPAVSEAAAIVNPQSHPALLTKPASGASTTSEYEAISEDQDREVFEL